MPDAARKHGLSSRIRECAAAEGLALTDRIALTVDDPDGEIAATLAVHGEAIAREVLARTVGAGAAAPPTTAERFTVGRSTVLVTVQP